MVTSLRSRLVLTHVLLAGLVLGLVAIGLLFFLSRNPIVERQIYRQLSSLATLVTTRDAGSLAAARPERISAALARAQQLRSLGGRAIVLGPRGGVLADSRSDLDPPPDETLIAAAQGAAEGDFRSSARRWLYVAQALEGGRVLFLAAPQPTPGSLVGLARDFAGPLLQTCLVGLVASLLLAWLTARWVTGPLRRAAHAAEAVSGGDLSARIKPEGPREVRQLAAMLNQMVGRVQASSQAQRDFVANVSHELKTPLTSIQGFAQAIQEGTVQDSEGLRRAARIIHEESDRLRRLVEDLLDLARLDGGQVAFERAPLDLNGLLASVVERIGPRAAEKSVRLESHLPAFPSMVGDADRLAQVFTNLLDNAVKFSPSGEPVRIVGETSAGWVSVHVEDSGPGIPPHELSRVFERFYQLDKARPGGAGRGVGLGLAISREIVQAHGGSVTAESRPGQGSRFSVRLPIARPQDSTLPGKMRRLR